MTLMSLVLLNAFSHTCSVFTEYVKLSTGVLAGSTDVLWCFGMSHQSSWSN